MGNIIGDDQNIPDNDVRPSEGKGPNLFVASQTFEGPLPPPEMLDQYSKLIPDAPNRFMILLEQQTEGRMQLEKKESRRDNYGLAAAFAIAVLVIAGGIFLIDRGHDWAGTSIICVNLIGLVSTFIYRSRNSNSAEA